MQRSNAAACAALLAAAGLISLGGVADRARADGEGEPGWVKETTDKGCYRLMASMVDSTTTTSGHGFVWTGPCTPGQPINGEGTFYLQDRSGFIMAYTGRIVNGFNDGPTQVAVYFLGGGPFPPSGSPASVSTESFRMGCSYEECQAGAVSNLVTIPPVSPAYFPLPGGPSSFAGSSTPAPSTPPPPTRSAADFDDTCVTMDNRGTGGSGWRVVNSCSYTAIGAWCYDDDGYFSCSTHQKGGFGPLGPGRSENVSSSPRGNASYRIAWCDYDDWKANRCEANKPWEVQR
ncbi:MAG: hypothetical protein K1X35_03330 [Caulobacteraceae bacterium]|nr:hypothetical protein [Caulobacteraceae bacterium]